MPRRSARAAVVVLALLPLRAPAFPYEVKGGETVWYLESVFHMELGEVGHSIEVDALEDDLADPFVAVPGWGLVRYHGRERLWQVAYRKGVTVDAIATSPGFLRTRLKRGAVLTLPNIPPACEVVKAPLRELPRTIGACIPQIVRRPEGIRYALGWTGDLVLAYLPWLGGLLAALTALGWGAGRFGGFLPSRREEWDE